MRILYFESKTTDREDFIEDKIQLSTAMQSGVPVLKGNITEIEQGDIIIGNGVSDGQYKDIQAYPRVDQISKAAKYHQHKTFLKYAGREIIQCKFDLQELVQASVSLGGNCVIKNMSRAKASMIGKIYAQTHRTSEEQIMDIYQYSLIQLEGDEAIAQEFINMNYEYRVFVVNGVPITGAGCIEGNTPLENYLIFDSKLQKIRGESSSSIQQKAATRYWNFANEVTPQFEKEGVLDYTLDLFIDDNDNIGIIELNPIHRSGFYAINYDLLFKAILRIGE